MSSHIRGLQVLWPGGVVVGGTNQPSATAYIGPDINVVFYIRNNDGTLASTLTAQVAGSGAKAGANYAPLTTEWFNLYDGTTGNLVQWSVGHNTQIAVNVPNLASKYVRLVSSANIDIYAAVESVT